MVETRAELPFTGDQVGLFRAQPGRPKQTSYQHILGIISCDFRSWCREFGKMERASNALESDKLTMNR
jgi:hypothetical protein